MKHQESAIRLRMEATWRLLIPQYSAILACFVWFVHFLHLSNALFYHVLLLPCIRMSAVYTAISTFIKSPIIFSRDLFGDGSVYAEYMKLIEYKNAWIRWKDTRNNQSIYWLRPDGTDAESV